MENNSPARIIRLDQRGTDVLENPAEATRQHAQNVRGVWNAIRDAEIVIDAQDRVVKHPTQAVPHAATMDLIDQSVLVQG